MSGAPTDPSGPTARIVSGNGGRVQRPGNVTGSVTAQGDTMKGNIQGVIDTNATLARQK